MEPKLHILNDLIRINIDRIDGYEKASYDETTHESKAREIFYRLAVDSRAFVNVLHAEVIRLGGQPVSKSTIAGKIYLHWLEGRNSFQGADTPARIAACAATELSVQKAYQQALNDLEHQPETIYQQVENQLWSVERAHQQLLNLQESFNHAI